MIKTKSEKIISRVVISTITEFGNGMFPYKFYPSYRNFLRIARESTTQLLKSSTTYKEVGRFIKHNPLTWKCVKRIPDDGIANAYKHTNPGAAVCADQIKKSIAAGSKIIPNYAPDFNKPIKQTIWETLEVIRLLYYKLGSDLNALEIKLYCPNIKQELEKNIRNSAILISEIRKLFPSLFLIIKVNYQHPFELSQEMELLGVGAIHAINAIEHSFISPNDPNPLGLDDCAISGGPIKPYSLSYNRELRKKIRIRILMGGGIMSFDDAREFMDIGNDDDSIVICSMVARHTREATKLIEIYN